MTDIPNMYIGKYCHGEVEYDMHLYRDMFELDFKTIKSILVRSVGTLLQLI